MAARKSKPQSTREQQLDASRAAASLVGAEEFMELLNDRWRFAWLNFRAGIYRGIGLTIGVALIIVALGWAVTVFGGLPYIGDFFRSIEQNATTQSVK